MEKEFEFDGVLSPSCIKHLLGMFVQHILYQRGQIPVHFDALNTLRSRAKPVVQSPDVRSSESSFTTSAASSVADIRATLKKERAETRQRRIHERLQRRIDAFMTAFQQQNDSLMAAVDSVGLERGLSVAVVLGASVFAARESYIVECPPAGRFYDVHPRRVSHRRSVLQLFRNLISWSALLLDPVPPTCVHVLVGAAARHHRDLVARPELRLAAPRNGSATSRRRVMRLRLRHAACEAVPPSVAVVSVCCCRGSSSVSVEDDGADSSSTASTVDVGTGDDADRVTTVGSTSGCHDILTAGSLRHGGTAHGHTAKGMPHLSDASHRGDLGDKNVIWWQIPTAVRGFRDPSVRQI